MVILLILFFISFANSLRIASVQYSLLGSGVPSSIIQSNVDAYIDFIASASGKKTELIVFPEGTLGWIKARSRREVLDYCEDIPDVGSGTMCNRKMSNALSRLSCAAIDYNITVQFNTCDRKNCEGNKCNQDGLLLRNTEIVVDSFGTILTKYFKAHLFGEAYKFDAVPPSENNIATSIVNIWNKTSLGIFTCFDMEFSWPARIQHAPPYDVTLFAMSSYWVNTLPLFNAIAIQQSWSRIYNSVLVASNTGTPGGSGGGIFSNGYALSYLFDNSHIVREILYADIDDNVLGSKGKEDNKEYNKEDKALVFNALHESITRSCQVGGFKGSCVDFNTESSIQNLSLSVSRDFTCHFSLKLSQTAGVNFVAFGLVSNVSFPYTPDMLPVQACAIVTCENFQNDVCLTTEKYSAAGIVETFSIFASFDSSALVFPMLLTDGAELISDPTVTSFFVGQTSSLSANTFQQPLYSATLYGILQN